MTSLRELEIKSTYDSEEDDILGSFYVPVLSKAIQYDRLAGFFSSSALAVAARGVVNLVNNDGRMRLITGAKLSKQDAEAITQAKDDPENILSHKMVEELDKIEDIIETLDNIPD